MLSVSNVTGSGASKTTNLIYTYSWVTNTPFYDNRESDTVQALQIDVNKFNTWLANSGTRGGQQYNNQNSSGSTSKGHRSIPFTPITMFPSPPASFRRCAWSMVRSCRRPA